MQHIPYRKQNKQIQSQLVQLIKESQKLPTHLQEHHLHFDYIYNINSIFISLFNQLLEQSE